MATSDFVVKNGLVVNEDALIRDTTDSSSKDTGALIVEGGVGVEKSLYVGEFGNFTGLDISSTGSLTALGTTSVTGFPNDVIVDPTGRFLYVTSQNGNNVHQFSINSTTGALTQITTAIAAGTLPRFIAIHPSGRFLYALNQNSGTISQYSINQTTGELTSITTAIAITNGANSGWNITIDPRGLYLYAVENFVITRYFINQSTGALTNQGTTSITGLFGQDIKFEPTGRYAYVTYSSPGTIGIFSVDQTNGILTSVNTIAAGSSVAFIEIDPSGRFLYASNFFANSVSQYSINPTNGALTQITTAISAPGFPRKLRCDPTGKFLYVADQSNNNIHHYDINQDTGQLTFIASYTSAGGNAPSLAITPSGKFLYAVSGNSDAVRRYKINSFSVQSGAFAGNISVEGEVLAASGNFTKTVNIVDNVYMGKDLYTFGTIFAGASQPSAAISITNSRIITNTAGQLAGIGFQFTGTEVGGIQAENSRLVITGSNNASPSFRYNGTQVFQINSAQLAVTSTTTSTSIGSGALTVAGGVGVTENLWVGGYINADNLRFENNTISSTNTNGNIILAPAGTGNVGIGTSDPQRKLTIQSDSDGTVTTVGLYNADTTNDNGTVVSFRTDTTGTGAATFHEVSAFQSKTTEHDHATRNTNFSIFTDSATTGLTEKFTVTGLGRVGIGTNVPDELLDVRGNIALTGSIIFEGATANAFETTLSVTEPTADNTITFPNASGTVAVSVTDTTTTTQGELNLDFTLSAAGNISATGTAQGLSTTSTPSFGGISFDGTGEGISWALNTDGASIKFYNTEDGDTNSRLEFNTSDNNDEYFRWTHTPSGVTPLYESMKLVPVSDGNSELTVNGSVFAKTLYTNSNIVFEGATANAFETTLSVTDPTADNTITLPDATGTVAVSVSDTTTTTQGELNLDFTLSAAGNISATGTAHNLATTSIPTFAGLYSGDIVVRGGAGASSEGAQITLGYGNNTTSTITGQSNNTWNIDVASGAANNDFRIFRQNSSGATQVALQITESSGAISLPTNISAWDTTTPGTNVGGLHLGAASSTANAGPAITFGARDTGSGATAQAGIYVTSDGTFGTRMYLATTDSYSNGSTAAMSISETGVVRILRNTASTSTTTGSLIVAGGVGISGALNATTKSFDIPHPTQPGKKLRYGSLEGPEFGVYVRGRLTNNNLIQLPEYWTKLVHSDSITVTLTPVGNSQNLYVKEIQNNIVYIEGSEFIDCFYTVWAERKDIDKLVVEGG